MSTLPEPKIYHNDTEYYSANEYNKVIEHIKELLYLCNKGEFGWEAPEFSSYNDIVLKYEYDDSKSVNCVSDIRKDQESIIKKLIKLAKYYGDTKNYEIPDIDSRGFGGMSARSIMELEDCETFKMHTDFAGDYTVFIGGKKAREVLSSYEITAYFGLE